MERFHRTAVRPARRLADLSGALVLLAMGVYFALRTSAL
jgi:hypothetical protein